MNLAAIIRSEREPTPRAAALIPVRSSLCDRSLIIVARVPFTGEAVELDMTIEIGVGDCLNMGLGDSDSLDEAAPDSLEDLVVETLLVSVLVGLSV
jgi:hypothetical protein